MAKSCIIEPNPDVTGIGIRISIYALCLISGLCRPLFGHIASVEQYLKFDKALKSALQLQYLALLFTAVNQTCRQQLTLFHGLSVLHLLTMLGFAIGVDYMDRRMRKIHGINVRLTLRGLLRFTAVAGYIGLSFYIWGTAPTFGSQPDCNKETSYVLLWANPMPGDDSQGVRFVMPVVASVFALVWLTNGWHPFGLFGLVLNGQGYGIPGDVRYLALFRAKVARVHENPNATMSDLLAARPAGLFTSSERIYRIGEICANTAVYIYMIVALELMHVRNKISHEEQDWSFGQIIALFLLLGVVWEVLDVVLDLLSEPETAELVDNADPEDEIEPEGSFDLGARYHAPLQFYPSSSRSTLTVSVSDSLAAASHRRG